MNALIKRIIERPRLLMGGGGLVIVVVLALVFGLGGGAAGGGSKYVTVTRGPMEVVVTGSGTVRAANAVYIEVPSSVRGDLQLVYLIPEGQVVPAGTIVARLDTTAAAEQLETELDALETAQAQFDQALVDLDNNIKDLENSVRSAELSWDQMQLRLQSLEFASALEQQQGELDVERARISLAEARRKLEAQKIINEADRRQQEINLQERIDDVAETRREIAALVITTPLTGMIIHAEQGRFSDRTKVKEGDTVRRGQDILQIPDLSVLQVAFTVNELDADQIQIGQPARVRLEAYPRQSFTGRVTDISTLAQETSNGGNVRVFPSVVTLDTSDDRIRPGMTAGVEVVVADLQETLQVPLAALGVIGGGCCVKLIGRTEPVTVELGLRNESMVQVVSGLAEGDRVELTWQEDASAVMAQLAGRRSLPATTVRSIQDQGQEYGKARVLVQPEAVPAGDTPRGGRGGRGMDTAGAAGQRGQGMTGFDPSTLTPEQRARFEQMRGQMGTEGGQAGSGFVRAQPDSARTAQMRAALQQRVATLPDTLRREIQQLLSGEGFDLRSISPALRDSLRAWNIMGGQRMRTPPPGEIPPGESLGPTGGR
jgi:HlyD family secretion protein